MSLGQRRNVFRHEHLPTERSILYTPFPMRHGFLLIDKPAGMTSHDVVAIVRRALHERSVGHLGTLDPLATGLLVLAIGRKALKVVELFNHLDKSYDADVRFGAVSTTYDAEGVLEKVLPPMGWHPPEQGELQRLLQDRFIGTIAQVPPAYSAISIGGERAYRKARQGLDVELPSRTVRIDSCSVLQYAYPSLTLHVRCGSGTYIRSLAHDLGQMVHAGAYLAGLRRTHVGTWSLAGSRAPEQVTWNDVLPLKDVLVGLPRRDISVAEYEDLRCGRNIEADVPELTIAWHDELPVALLVQATDGTAHAKKVF